MNKREHELRRQLNHERKARWKLGSDLIDARAELKALRRHLDIQRRYFEEAIEDLYQRIER